MTYFKFLLLYSALLGKHNNINICKRCRSVSMYINIYIYVCVKHCRVYEIITDLDGSESLLITVPWQRCMKQDAITKQRFQLNKQASLAST